MRRVNRSPGSSTWAKAKGDSNRREAVYGAAAPFQAPSWRSMVELTGFEPVTPCLQSRCSPAELQPHL